MIVYFDRPFLINNLFYFSIFQKIIKLFSQWYLQSVWSGSDAANKCQVRSKTDNRNSKAGRTKQRAQWRAKTRSSQKVHGCKYHFQQFQKRCRETFSRHYPLTSISRDFFIFMIDISSNRKHEHHSFSSTIDPSRFWPKKVHFLAKIDIFLNFMLINFLMPTLQCKENLIMYIFTPWRHEKSTLLQNCRTAKNGAVYIPRQLKLT